MNIFMNLFKFILVIATAWDGLTTIYGTVAILGFGVIQIILALIFAALILSFLLITAEIWSGEWRGDMLGKLLRFFWIIAIAYDLYTSFLGNRKFVIEPYGEEQQALLIGLTILVSGSPVLISLLRDHGSPETAAQNPFYDLLRNQTRRAR